MNINVKYVYQDEDNSEVLKQRSLWDKASLDQVQLYSIVLAEMLHAINIPVDAAICTNNKYINHKKDIFNYHDAIVKCMLDASKETIPQSKCSHINKVDSKTVRGWNENVDSYFQTSLFMHSMWIQNGKPHSGVVADIWRRSRAQYHCICKMVLKIDAEIRCDKMTGAILINPSGQKLHQ